MITDKFQLSNEYGCCFGEHDENGHLAYSLNMSWVNEANKGQTRRWARIYQVISWLPPGTAIPDDPLSVLFPQFSDNSDDPVYDEDCDLPENWEPAF